MLAPWESQSASLPRQKGNRVLFLAAHHCVTLPHSYVELQIDSSELQLGTRNTVEFTLLTVRRQDQSGIFLADPILHCSMIIACQQYPHGGFSCSHPRSSYRQELLPRAEMLGKELPFLHLSAPTVLLEFRLQSSGCHEVAPCHGYAAVNVIALVPGKIH